MDELSKRLNTSIADHRAHIARLEAEYGRGTQIDERHAAIALNFGDVVDLADALTTLQAERDASRKLVQQAMVALAHRRPTGSDCKVAYALLQDARAKLSPPVI